MACISGGPLGKTLSETFCDTERGKVLLPPAFVHGSDLGHLVGAGLVPDPSSLSGAAVPGLQLQTGLPLSACWVQPAVNSKRAMAMQCNCHNSHRFHEDSIVRSINKKCPIMANILYFCDKKMKKV